MMKHLLLTISVFILALILEYAGISGSALWLSLLLITMHLPLWMLWILSLCIDLFFLLPFGLTAMCVFILGAVKILSKAKHLSWVITSVLYSLCILGWVVWVHGFQRLPIAILLCLCCSAIYSWRFWQNKKGNPIHLHYV